jgi:3-oxoacyl-[acyl-carrier protein] reductase
LQPARPLSVGKLFEAVMEERRALNPTRRFGMAADFGAACAFPRCVHAGYTTGQNLLMDDGAYPGTF